MNKDIWRGKKLQTGEFIVIMLLLVSMLQVMHHKPQVLILDKLSAIQKENTLILSSPIKCAVGRIATIQDLAKKF